MMVTQSMRQNRNFIGGTSHIIGIAKWETRLSFQKEYWHCRWGKSFGSLDIMLCITFRGFVPIYMYFDFNKPQKVCVSPYILIMIPVP